jgi:hypothetical protein
MSKENNKLEVASMLNSIIVVANIIFSHSSVIGSWVGM